MKAKERDKILAAYKRILKESENVKTYTLGHDEIMDATLVIDVDMDDFRVCEPMILAERTVKYKIGGVELTKWNAIAGSWVASPDLPTARIFFANYEDAYCFFLSLVDMAEQLKLHYKKIPYTDFYKEEE